MGGPGTSFTTALSAEDAEDAEDREIFLTRKPIHRKGSCEHKKKFDDLEEFS